MTGYVVQRLVSVVVIMVAMSLLVFLATHALPPNAAALILGQYSTPEMQAALEHKLGFDQPLPVQYWHWASHMLQGDLGQSFEMERPVAPILWDALSRSAILVSRPDLRDRYCCRGVGAAPPPLHPDVARLGRG